MDAQMQLRATRAAGRLSVIMRDTSARVHATQQTILQEKARREVEKKRLIDGRVSRARQGLRRFRKFASSRAIQKLIKANERLNGKGQFLSFHEFDWNLIGSNLTSHVSFSIGVQGVMVTMTNTCWMRMDVSATFPYKGSVVTVETKFASKDKPMWESSVSDVLDRMVDGLMGSLNEVGEESEAALKTLGLWKRAEPFEKIATSFLEQFELEVADKLQQGSSEITISSQHGLRKQFRGPNFFSGKIMRFLIVSPLMHDVFCASVAQLVEHSTDTRAVPGSTPGARTKNVMQKSSSA